MFVKCPSARPRCACGRALDRSEEHTSELQSRSDLVCRLLLEKKNRREMVRVEVPGRCGSQGALRSQDDPLRRGIREERDEGRAAGGKEGSRGPRRGREGGPASRSRDEETEETCDRDQGETRGEDSGGRGTSGFREGARGTLTHGDPPGISGGASVGGPTRRRINGGSSPRRIARVA